LKENNMMLKEVEAAHTRINKYIFQTEVIKSDVLSSICNTSIYLKLENRQNTGSFKIRGACNKLLTLPPRFKQKPVVTASSGNHGNAFAWLVHKLGMKGIIYLPENVSPAKLEALKAYKVEIRLTGDDTLQAEMEARKFAAKEKVAYISPYNDKRIIEGQATIGLEIMKQVPGVTHIVVPVGGGGLAAGVGAYMKRLKPRNEFWGCQPVNSKVMYESIQAGKILDLPSNPTLADGTAGGIEADSITFPICQRVLDKIVLVSEIEILDAIKMMIAKHQILLEGAGALPVAAVIKARKMLGRKKVVLVLTGEKISKATLNALY